MESPDTSTPLGSYKSAWIGFARSEAVRKHAASGGLVTATFDYLLRKGHINAALVCHSAFKDGKLDYRLFLAESLEELTQAQSSKYFDIPMLKGIDLIKQYDGKVGVVGLPSQISAFTRRASHSKELAQKIAFKISIFCGHNSKSALIEAVWARHKIKPEEVDSFYFRQGHWRGQMVITLKNGEERRMPFQEFSHFQNLHILSLDRCLNCYDHMGYYADLSTGDTWSGAMKKEPIKHSIFIGRTHLGDRIVQGMLEEGVIEARPVTRRELYLSQKRSINYHYGISARARLAKRMGFNIKDRTGEKPSTREMLAARIVLLNHRMSRNPKLLRLFMRLPKPIVWCYLCLFKGLMNYERKDY